MLQRCDSISPNYVWSDLRDLTWLTTTHNLDCISVFLCVKEQQVFAHSLPKHFLCCTAVAKITSSVILWVTCLSIDLIFELVSCSLTTTVSDIMSFLGWPFGGLGLLVRETADITLAWFCSEMSSHLLPLCLCCELLYLVVNLVKVWDLFLIEGGRLREP